MFSTRVQKSVMADPHKKVTDITQAVRTPFVFSKLFGLFSHLHEPPKKRIFCLNSICNVVFMTFYFIYVFYKLPEIYPIFYSKRLNLFVDGGIMTSTLAAYYVTIITSYVNTRKLYRQIKQFKKIDLSLRNLGYRVYNNKNLFDVMTFLSLTMIPAFYFLDIIYFTDVLENNSPFLASCQVLCYYLPLFSIHLFYIQWFCFVKFIGDRFLLMRRIIKKAMTMSEVEILTKTSTILEKTAREINEVYGLSNLAGIVFSSVGTVNNLYFSIGFLLNPKYQNTLLVYLIWFVVSLDRIIGVCVIVYVAEWTTKQALKWNRDFFDLAIRDRTGRISQNPKIFLHISSKTELRFTAYGFFQMDFTLIRAMISSAATFLVILLQFSGS